MSTRCSRLDLDRVLAAVAKPPCRAAAEREVTEAQLLAKANEMARRGYEHSAESLRALEEWMRGRGLVVFGDVGVGKTFFFQCLRIPLEPREGDHGGTIRLFRMADVVGMGVRELQEELDSLAPCEVAFDDVGAEPVFNEYGSRWEAFPWMVERRLRTDAKTHFTTNLTPDELCGRYGSRTVDRMHELACSVVFRGGSRRTTR